MAQSAVYSEANTEYIKEQFMPEQQLRAQLEALQQTLEDPEIQLSIQERSSLE